MSAAPHRRRPVTVKTTLALALMAGIITLWLGLMANLGQIANREPAGTAAAVPDRLSVVQVEPGESLQDVAHRVVAAASARQVADRIRELNNLNSPALAAGHAGRARRLTAARDTWRKLLYARVVRLSGRCASASRGCVGRARECTGTLGAFSEMSAQRRSGGRALSVLPPSRLASDRFARNR